MLSDSQRATAEQALELVGPCISYFLDNYPCLREVMTIEDMQSAAAYACASAAKTYDPTRAGISAYFSRAILHELLKSCQRELKGNGVWRVSLAVAEVRMPLGKLAEDDPAESMPAPVIEALASMSAEDRRWIQSCTIEGVSVREMSRREGISTRQGAKLLRAKLSRLAKASGLQCPEVPRCGSDCVCSSQRLASAVCSCRGS